MFLERLAILALIVAAALALAYVWRCCLRRRVERLAQTDAPAAVRQLISSAPAVLYFTTPECAQCRYQQAPILEELAQRARIAVYAVDAVAQQDLARHYGIMTVPSTVLLNPRLQPVAVNHGLATPEQLDRQVAKLNVR